MPITEVNLSTFHPEFVTEHTDEIVKCWFQMSDLKEVYLVKKESLLQGLPVTRVNISGMGCRDMSREGQQALVNPILSFGTVKKASLNNVWLDYGDPDDFDDFEKFDAGDLLPLKSLPISEASTNSMSVANDADAEAVFNILSSMPTFKNLAVLNPTFLSDTVLALLKVLHGIFQLNI